MHVSAASLDGQPLEVLERESLRSDMLRIGDNGTVLFVLPQPLEPGHSYELEIRHDGAVVTPAGNDVYFVGGPNQLVSQPRPQLRHVRHDVPATRRT